MQQVINENKQILARQASAEQEKESEPPAPETSASGDGAKKRGGETPAAAEGRQKHEEFAEKVKRKATAIQDIRDIVEQKLAQMLARNPMRMDYQRKYEEIVAGYNREKDRTTIEAFYSGRNYAPLWIADGKPDVRQEGRQNPDCNHQLIGGDHGPAHLSRRHLRKV